MALVSLAQAARHLGYASQSQLKRLRDQGRIDDFRHRIGRRELIQTDGLEAHIASIITQRASGNVCKAEPEDYWQQVADVVNGWLEPKCWGDAYPFTAQQLATLSVCTREAAKEVRSASLKRQ